MHPPKQPITYVIYARKSSESDEKQVQSIDDQIRVLQDLARDLNLTVVATFSEARSAKEPHNRAVFEEMLSALTTGKADGILTWKIDRLSRNPIDSATIQWLLQQETIKSIQTIGREYLPEDNAVIFSIESSMANQYIRDLSRNVKRGLQSKVEKGISPGRAPLGYRNTITKPRGENYIIKDRKRFKIIRKAWDLMLTGNYTGTMILDILNNEYGLRTPKTKRSGGKPLARSALYRLFADPFYTGQFRYNGLLYQGIHDAMITIEEFDRVQVLLGRKSAVKQQQHHYAYVGLLQCGECGGPVSATHKEKVLKCTGKPKAYTLYYCIPARKHGTCSQRHYTNANLLDAQIAKEIQSYTILPEFRDWALAISKERDSKKEKEAEEIRATQESALADAKQQVDKLTDMYLKDLLSEEEYKERKNALTQDIASLEQMMQQAETTYQQLHQTAEKRLNFAADAYELFQDGDDTIKKSIFSDMRLNSTLKGKKLTVHAPFWLTAIKEQYPPLKQEMQALELRFGRGTKRYLKAREALIPKVRGLMDDIGTGVKDFSQKQEG